jgi:hypothetical protein
MGRWDWSNLKALLNETFRPRELLAQKDVELTQLREALRLSQEAIAKKDAHFAALTEHWIKVLAEKDAELAQTREHWSEAWRLSQEAASQNDAHFAALTEHWTKVLAEKDAELAQTREQWSDALRLSHEVLAQKDAELAQTREQWSDALRLSQEALVQTQTALEQDQKLLAIIEADSPEALTKARSKKHGAATTRKLPPILLNALPKSAGTYIRATLEKGLDLRNLSFEVGTYPYTSVDYRKFDDFVRGGGIVHHHLRHQEPSQWYLKRGNVRTVLHLRDPRASVLSWTHHLRGYQDKLRSDPTYLTQHAVFALNEKYFALPFSAQIDLTIEHYLPIFMDWLTGWLQIEARGELPILITHFEEFARDRSSFFDRILDFYEIPHATFVDPQLPPGVETRFRSGQIDEWRGVFSQAQQEKIRAAIPRDLFERFGWSE